MLLALSQATSLLLLFVVLPVLVGPLVVMIVSRRAPDSPGQYRTSDLLRDGEPANAELLDSQVKGTFLFDPRPMVAFRLEVHRGDGEPFELTVTQSIPRAMLREFTPGMRLEIRLAADGSAGAIVLPDPESESGSQLA